jgi:hypothetical protein
VAAGGANTGSIPVDLDKLQIRQVNFYAVRKEKRNEKKRKEEVRKDGNLWNRIIASLLN